MPLCWPHLPLPPLLLHRPPRVAGEATSPMRADSQAARGTRREAGGREGLGRRIRALLVLGEDGLEGRRRRRDSVDRRWVLGESFFRQAHWEMLPQVRFCWASPSSFLQVRFSLCFSFVFLFVFCSHFQKQNLKNLKLNFFNSALKFSIIENNVDSI